MARVNRTTGFFLVLGMIVLVMSVSAAWYIESGNGDKPDGGSSQSADESLLFGDGHVDVRSRMSNPSPGVPGVVFAIEVKEFEKVTAGQVLLRLDDTTARGQLQKLKDQVELAKLEVGRAQLRVNEHKGKIAAQKHAVVQAENAIKEAKENHQHFEKLKQLFKGHETDVSLALLAVKKATDNHSAAREMLESLENNVPNILVTEAERQVKALESQVQEAERALDRNYVVRAPKNGRIFRLNVSVGDPIGLLAANMEPAIWFCPDEPLVVRAEINQQSAMRVKEGADVTLYLHDSKGGPSWKGKVESVSQWASHKRRLLLEPDQVNDARVRECVIRFVEPPPAELVIGTLLRVQISAKK